MANSLRVKLKNLYYKGNITTKEYDELVHKLDGHDREIRNKTIDEFVKKLKEHDSTCNFDWEYYDEIAEQLKAGVLDGNI